MKLLTSAKMVVPTRRLQVLVGSYLRNVGTKQTYSVLKHLPRFQGRQLLRLDSENVGNHVLACSYCYGQRKVDITSGKQTFMFDTHKLIKRLESSGMTTEQSEVIVESLLQLMEADLDYQNKTMVTKPQQEIMMQQIMTHIGAVKKDMIILEKSEFSQLKHEYEKQHIEINQLKKNLGDEIQKLRSSVSLDLSLERSRAKEAHGENSTKLSNITNKIDMGKSDMEKQWGKLDNKIEKEIANLIARYERYRNDVMKYAAGTVMTCLTICLGFYRLWAK